MKIRVPDKSDLQNIALILDEAELFPAEILEQMIAPFFDQADCLEKWLVCEDGSNGVIGFCYFRPEPLAAGTWNLLAIGFRDDRKGHGYGSRLVAEVERALASERVLIVETSGLEDFAATRTFYEKCGYEREAVIRDYWADGDDKVIYRKLLG